MKPGSEAHAPTIQKRTVARGRLPNANYRTREYLTEREVERLMKAAGDNRHGHRDATMILLAFRHGLRASELCSFRWEQVDLAHGRLHVSRLKNGMASVHPLTGTSARPPKCLSRSIRTCCATPADSSSPMTVRTRGRFSTISGIRTFNTRSNTPSCHPSGSRTFGRIRSPERVQPIAT